MSLISTIIFSTVVGFLPAMFWLYYWLQEDKKNPEPAIAIFSTFFYGMLAVPAALVVQYTVNVLILQGRDISNLFFTNYAPAIITLIIWASTEEILKYIAAHKGGLSKKDNNEPLDPIIYMITAALGFSALENTLFIFAPFLTGDTVTALLTGNMRFIGASLLHVSASGIIGMFLAFAFYKSKKVKKRYLYYGVFLSIALHTIFNSFIIRGDNFTLLGFVSVWVSIVVIIMLFEKVKKIYKPINKPTNYEK